MQDGTCASANPSTAGRPGGITGEPWERDGKLMIPERTGDMPAHLDPDLEAVTLVTMSAGLGTSVLVGHSSVEQAQAVIDYHLYRLFPASRPASAAAQR
jgi:hypothetical protein